MKNFLIIIFGISFVTAQIPLPEHPRPDFKRPQWINLNGVWEFKFDSNDIGVSNKWFNSKTNFEKKINVPFPWGSKLSNLNDEADIGWYKKNITVPENWKSKKTYLTIGASDWETSIWLDGQFIGSHQGGYVPFSFDLTPFLKYGKAQSLVIRVDDDAGDPRKFKRGYALYGKQGYGNARGIWQTVYLEARGNNFIDAVHFTPDIDNKKVNVKAYLDKYANKELSLNIKIKTKNGSIEKNTTFKPGQAKRSFDIDIPEMRLWTLDDPYLYEVEIKLDNDFVESYFGMRKISTMNLPGTEHPYVALNNKPIYLQLALDQSYHPDGYYTFPTDKFMKEEILRSKSIGLNGIRVHIKLEVPRKLYWADKLGILVVEDLPNSWGEPDKFMRKESEYTLEEMIKRDYNHPSIFSWVIFNEQWGLQTKDENNNEKILPETYKWVTSMYYKAKSLDGSRLIEDNSLCCGGLHTATDLNSWHAYLPGYDWDDYLKDQVQRNFKGGNHLYYDGFKQENQPFLNSECGNVWGYSGSTGDVDWSYDYHRMMNSFRKFPEVAGWLYTEHHDVINEWNGYWKYDRSEKETGLNNIFKGMKLNDLHSSVYISNQGDITQTVKGNENIEIPIYLSSMTDKDYGDELYLHYQISHLDYVGIEKEINKGVVKIDYFPWMNQPVSPLKIKTSKYSGLSKINFTLKNKEGKIIHRNFMHLVVKSEFKIPKTFVYSIPAKEYSSSKWSKRKWEVLDGLKVNGTGEGFFELKIPLPSNLDLTGIKEAYFVIEASSKQLYDKDKVKDYSDAGIDYMRGSKISPHKNPNSYPMTDEIIFSSEINVSVNDKNKMNTILADDPADHRGVLSWHNQIRPAGKVTDKDYWEKKRMLNEAGSYGYLVKVPISNEELTESKQNGFIKILFETTGEGGMAIYGKDFGRYPFDPSLVIIKKN